MAIEAYRVDLPDVVAVPLYETYSYGEDLSVSLSSFEDQEIDFLFSEPVGFIGRMSRSRHWCFTLNNYTDGDLDRLAALEGRVDYLIFGKEVGLNGTPHLQGFVSFPTRIRLTAVIQHIGQAHCTVARHVKQAIEYCRKDGEVTEFGVQPTVTQGRRNELEDFKNAVTGGELDMRVLRDQFSEVCAKYPRFVQDFVADNTPKPAVDAHPLRPWQQTLYDDLRRAPGDREVIFIVDVLGNSGKSWFCHYYSALHENCQVILPGKKADMTYVLDAGIRVLFVDAPRSKQGEFIQYDFLEDVKNGYVFSPKYESRIKYLGKVHVVVMMNEMPDQSKLSSDRFDIRVVNRNS